MIRATTGGVMRTYRKNLMGSFVSMNKARDTVLSQRNFNSYAEDPAAAAKAFRLRKARMSVESQYSVCSDAYKKYQTAFSCLDSVDKLIDTENGGSQMTTLKSTTLEMLNDPKGDARVQLNKVLDQMSETIVQTMNQTYGGKFIFAGADAYNVPFTVEDNKLYYRGVSVDGVPQLLTKPGGNRYTSDYDASYILANAKQLTQAEYDAGIADGSLDADNYDSYVGVNAEKFYILRSDTIKPADYHKAEEDAAKLDALMKENNFVDIGLGFKENEDNKLIESSAFDVTLNGVDFLGHGYDADGDPKNIYSLVQKLRDVANTVPDSGSWSADTYERFRGLVTKLEAASSEYKTQFTNMDASTTKLKNNQALLEESFYNLQDQYSEIEDVDMADAITSFVWAQYCYNAALKVGNNVLGQSLMDYLQ